MDNEQSNVGLGMVPCKKNCRCSDCQIEHLNNSVRTLEEKRVELNVEIGERDAEIERLRASDKRVRKDLFEQVDANVALTVEGERRDILLSQLYQIVGCMADDLDIFNEPKMQRLLGEINEPTGQQFLPWPSFDSNSGSPAPSLCPTLLTQGRRTTMVDKYHSAYDAAADLLESLSAECSSKDAAIVELWTVAGTSDLDAEMALYVGGIVAEAVERGSGSQPDISDHPGWDFVNKQADSGNGKCWECSYSKGIEGSAHECTADHPTDCFVYEEHMLAKETADSIQSSTNPLVNPERYICTEHGRFPCRDCGTTHFDGCQCYFCAPVESSSAPRWSKESPSEQGWYWYRKNNYYHPVPTFVEDCGGDKFRAVEVYQQKMIWVGDAGVEWWPVQIIKPTGDDIRRESELGDEIESAIDLALDADDSMKKFNAREDDEELADAIVVLGVGWDQQGFRYLPQGGETVLDFEFVSHWNVTAHLLSKLEEINYPIVTLLIYVNSLMKNKKVEIQRAVNEACVTILTAADSIPTEDES